MAIPGNCSRFRTHWSAPQVSAEVGSYLIAIGYFSVATAPARESRVCPQMEENDGLRWKKINQRTYYSYATTTWRLSTLAFFLSLLNQARLDRRFWRFESYTLGFFLKAYLQMKVDVKSRGGGRDSRRQHV